MPVLHYSPDPADSSKPDVPTTRPRINTDTRVPDSATTNPDQPTDNNEGLIQEDDDQAWRRAGGAPQKPKAVE